MLRSVSCFNEEHQDESSNDNHMFNIQYLTKHEQHSINNDIIYLHLHIKLLQINGIVEKFRTFFRIKLSSAWDRSRPQGMFFFHLRGFRRMLGPIRHC